MIGHYLEHGSSAMGKTAKMQYNVPTKCATCKHASRSNAEKHSLIHFLAFCTSRRRSMETVGFSNLIHTHVRDDMHVPEQDCNFYEENV
jgi:hypothetical protein